MRNCVLRLPSSENLVLLLSVINPGAPPQTPFPALCKESSLLCGHNNEQAKMAQEFQCLNNINHSHSSGSLEIRRFLRGSSEAHLRCYAGLVCSITRGWNLAHQYSLLLLGCGLVSFCSCSGYTSVQTCRVVPPLDR